jgi:hypothetical protein
MRADDGVDDFEIPRIPLRYDPAVLAGKALQEKLRTARAPGRRDAYDVVTHPQAAMSELLTDLGFTQGLDPSSDVPASRPAHCEDQLAHHPTSPDRSRDTDPTERTGATYRCSGVGIELLSRRGRSSPAIGALPGAARILVAPTRRR